MSKATIDVLSCAKSVLKSEIAGLFAAANMLSRDFADAVDLMINAKGRVILSGMGKPGHIARKISATLSSTGTKSFFMHPAEASHGDLGVISKDDVLLVLSYSGETQELFSMLNYAKRFGVPIIGITKNPNSTLANASTVTILMPNVREACPNNLAPTTSSTIMLALGDALAVCLLEMRNFSKDDFKQFHPGGALGKKLQKAKDLMHTDMPLVHENTKMGDVILTMTAMAFGCAGIIDDDKHLIGIITDGDLRRHLSTDLLGMSAKEIMTKSPVSVAPEMFAVETTKLLNDKKITSIFVVEDGIPQGIIHVHDCLRAGLI